MGRQAPLVSLPLVLLLLLPSLAAVFLTANSADAHAVRPTRRDYARLSTPQVEQLAKLGESDKILDHRDPTSLLSRILIPRPPDTENSTLVREAILDVFRTKLGPSSHSTTTDWTGSGKLGWHIDTPSFVAKTPEGPRTMTNIILTKNPAAPRKLIIAAHYDSKYFAKSTGMSGFIGATDSAAPCAMMVDLAVALDDALDARERKLHEQHVSKHTRSDQTTLQLVFFDGEEAYRTWTHTDSIYGSRQLAQQWLTTFWNASHFDDDERAPLHHRLTARRYRSSLSPVRHMDTIEHLVLLDLLGAPNPTVPSYFSTTEWLHRALMDAEERLNAARLLGERHRSFFSTRQPFGGIEDDHLPFLHAGVPILHVIPSPFPKVWHKMSDDASALHYPTTRAWALILRTVVAEYLQLPVVNA